jgi:hypothetical protein
MFKKLFFILLFLSLKSLGQVASSPQYNSCVFPHVNFVKNPCFEGVVPSSITDAGSISSISSSSPIEGKSSLLIDASSNGQVVKIKTKGISKKLAGGNCLASYYVSGDASLYKTAVFTGSNNLTGDYTQLENVSSGSRLIKLPFACGAESDTPELHIQATSNSAAAIKVDSVYIGECGDACSNEQVITPWKNCSSVAAGTFLTAETTDPAYGAVVNNTCRWRRVGQNAELEWDYYQSANTGYSLGSGIYYLNIPPEIGLIDTNAKTVNTNTSASDYARAQSSVGNISVLSGAGYIHNGVAVVHSSTKVKFQVGYTGGAQGGIIFGSTSSCFDAAYCAILAHLSVPIAGWANVAAIRLDQSDFPPRAYTSPTGTAGLGTLGSSNLVYWRKGKFLYMSGTLTTGTVAASPGGLTLPDGLHVDPSFSAAAHVVGDWKTNSDGGNTFDTSLIYVPGTSTTNIYFSRRYGPNGDTPLSLQNASAIISSSSVFSIDFKVPILEWQENQNAPLLVGSVTSTSAGADKIVAGEFYTTTKGTVCSSSPCTINGSDPGVSSVTRIGAGDYTINFVAGTFSAKPICTFTVYNSGSVNCEQNAYQNSNTSTAYRMTFVNCGAGSGSDVSAEFSCKGPR